MANVPNMLEGLKAMMAKRKGEKSIACFVDGPNIIRKELGIDLEKVRKSLGKHGKLKVAKVFLDQYASDKLIEAVTNQGFDPVVVPSDVDVALAVEAIEACFNDNIDVIAIVSRDSDFKPVVMKAKERGKETIVAGCEPDFSSAVRNAADIVINLKE